MSKKSKKRKKKPLYKRAKCILTIAAEGFEHEATFSLRPVRSKTRPKNLKATGLWIGKKQSEVARLGDWEVTLLGASIEADRMGDPAWLDASLMIHVYGSPISRKKKEGWVWYNGSEHEFILLVDVSNCGLAEIAIKPAKVDPRLPKIKVSVDIPAMRP